MTDKKENIIQAALELFASEGYNAVATSKIAKVAGVSEGLIFRHFENKKGLLDAIMQDAEIRISQVFAPILFELDPQKVIQKTLELPFSIEQKEYNFWKLQYKLKWEPEYHNPRKMKPVLDKLEWAFAELGYQNPPLEAELVIYILDSIAIAILREGLQSQLKFKSFLVSKYNS
ncbi:MAG: helix-turn-helix transcriptional regulator [Bacteroidia bacterium]|nr:helix-turn-helix transcriptional regulator [Bacteroidia bacterium]